jgi:hypothetical protein
MRVKTDCLEFCHDGHSPSEEWAVLARKPLRTLEHFHAEAVDAHSVLNKSGWINWRTPIPPSKCPAKKQHSVGWGESLLYPWKRRSNNQHGLQQMNASSIQIWKIASKLKSRWFKEHLRKAKQPWLHCQIEQWVQRGGGGAEFHCSTW